MTDSQPVPKQWLQPVCKQWLQKPEIMNFANSWKKFELLDKRAFELVETRRADSLLPAWATPICKLSMLSMVWNISIGQLGLAAWLYSLPAPAHLLISWIWETGYVLDFIATAKNISVINILPLLNPKYSSYWEGNELCPTQNQDSSLFLFSPPSLFSLWSVLCMQHCLG